jgi:hypothetical protein
MSATIRTPTRLAAVLLALASVTALARPAVAVRRFPEGIRSYFQSRGADAGADGAVGGMLSYTPPCRLCHIQGTTGAGSVQTPFGISMLARGLTQDESTLIPALTAMDTQKVDSDGDGVDDITEILEDRDPNTPLPASLSSGAPTYGCGTAGTVCTRGWPLFAAAAGLLLAIRRRSRARRHRPPSAESASASTSSRGSART